MAVSETGEAREVGQSEIVLEEGSYLLAPPHLSLSISVSLSEFLLLAILYLLLPVHLYPFKSFLILFSCPFCV